MKFAQKALLFLTVLLFLPLAGFILTLDLGIYTKASIWIQILPALSNTVLITISTSIIALALGSSLFWLIGFNNFRGRRFARILVFIPIAMPIYVTSFAYSHFFEYNPLVLRALKYIGLQYLGWKSLGGAIFVLSLGLYPYIYIFMQTMKPRLQNLVIVAKMHRYSSFEAYKNVLFAFLRPIIIFSVALISMEIISEYGLMTQYGINSFSTLLYNKWFYERNLGSSSALALLIFMFVALLLIIEEKSRKQLLYRGPELGKLRVRYELSGWRSVGAAIYVWSVIILATILPISELLRLSFGTHHLSINKVLMMIVNSGFVAIITALLAVLFGFFLNSKLLSESKANGRTLVKMFLMMAYGLPGVLISISLIIWASKLGAFLGRFSDSIEVVFKSLLFSTTFGIIYGCFFRFSTMAVFSIESNFKSVRRELIWALKVYGRGGIRGQIWLFGLLKQELIIVFLMIFVEVLKELPITLVMRPFNFDSLTTTTYELLSDERFEEASVYGLCTIGLCLAAFALGQKLKLRTRSNL